MPVLGSFLKKETEQVSDLKKEIERVSAFNRELSKFDELSRLIMDHEAFARALSEVDQMYSAHIYMKPNENRARYSVEVMKRYKFVDRFLYSHALSTHAYAMYVKQIFELIDKNETFYDKYRSNLFYLTEIFVGNVSRTLAVLYGLDVPLPKWTIVAGMIAYEVRKNSNLNTINKSAFSHMHNSISSLIKDISRLKESCSVHLGEVYAVDKPQDYDTLVSVLTARTSAMDKAHESNVLKYGSPIERFEFQMWQFMYKMTEQENLNLFMGGTSSDVPLDIDWSKLLSSLNFKLNGIRTSNKNEILLLYEKDLGSNSNIQVLLKNVYRTVVVRYVLIAVTYCENMDNWINKNPTDFKNNIAYLKTLCSPFADIVAQANVFLGGDKFMIELLQLLLADKKDNSVPEVTKIVIKITEFLYVMSGLLCVDVTGYVKPLKGMLGKDSDWNTLLLKVVTAINDLSIYVSKISNTFPLLDFKILDNIQNPIWF